MKKHVFSVCVIFEHRFGEVLAIMFGVIITTSLLENFTFSLKPDQCPAVHANERSCPEPKITSLLEEIGQAFSDLLYHLFLTSVRLRFPNRCALQCSFLCIIF